MTIIDKSRPEQARSVEGHSDDARSVEVTTMTREKKSGPPSTSFASALNSALRDALTEDPSATIASW